VDRSLVDQLCTFAGRGACTDAERRAAADLHDQLRADGCEAWVEARWTRPQSWASLLWHAALLVAGSLASIAWPIPATAVMGVAAVSLGIEAAGRIGPLRFLLPRRATQHVLVVPGAEGVALLVSAAYDAPRAAMARAPRARRLAARLPLRPLTWVAAAGVLVAVCGAARIAGISAGWLGAVQLVPTLLLLAVVAAAVDGMTSAWSRGAIDNASGVAVAVTLFEELARRPPAGLSPGLLLHGAGMPGPQALRRHLRGEKLGPRDVLVLEIGPCGPGTPAWATRHSQVRSAALRAGDALGVAPVRGLRAPEGTGRLPAVTVGTVGAFVAPRDDTPDGVDPAALDAVVDFALAMIDALDADLASGRRPIVNSG
jgi:hypothetical protein